MASYFAAVFTDLVRHSLAWDRVARTAMVSIIAEYRYIAQSIASQYGRRHGNFTGDGHLFLFESAEVAVQFGLKLIAYWKQRRRYFVSVHNAPDLPIRLGCHFGECSQFEDADAWVGRAINIAKRVEAAAEPDTFFITQTVLELIDLPFYHFREAGLHNLKGDFLAQRQLYRMLAVDHKALAERPPGELSAEDWFLRAVGLAESELSDLADEADCYQNALRLRPNYPEAHNNLAILLKERGDEQAARLHYEEALRLWPQYPEAHYNYAILLESGNDLVGAVQHLQRAIRYRSDYVDARLRYANLLAASGNEADAERNYQELLSLRPDYAEAHNNYAVLLEKLGQPALAERHYLKALETRSDYAQAHYNYAMFLETIDRTKAAAHYRAAIQILPDYAEAHNNLAVLLHEQGDLAEASAHYAAALRLRPNDPETNYNFALLAQAQGDANTAQRHFRLSEALTRGASHSEL